MVTWTRRRRCTTFLVALVGVLTGGLAGCTAAPPPAPTSTATSTASVALEPAAHAQDLVDATNDARVAEGLAALTVSSCAARAAAQRASALVGVPDLTHAPMDDVLQECDVTRTAENLSRASAPAQDVVDAWLGSPGHRNNLLDPELREIGVACVPDGPALVCSQVFLGS